MSKDNSVSKLLAVDWTTEFDYGLGQEAGTSSSSLPRRSLVFHITIRTQLLYYLYMRIVNI
jgi:hypothetical protein